MTYWYFTHQIDEQTQYCTVCGRFLMELQENKKWVGTEVHPACIEAKNVTAISHRVRNHDRRG